MDCGMMVVSGSINNIKITAVASDFEFQQGPKKFADLELHNDPDILKKFDKQ